MTSDDVIYSMVTTILVYRLQTHIRIGSIYVYPIKLVFQQNTYKWLSLFLPLRDSASWHHRCIQKRGMIMLCADFRLVGEDVTLEDESVVRVNERH